MEELTSEEEDYLLEQARDKPTEEEIYKSLQREFEDDN